MCYICFRNPQDYVSDSVLIKKIIGKFKQLELDKFEAALIKETLTDLEKHASLATCSAGIDQVNYLKNRRYDIARRL